MVITRTKQQICGFIRDNCKRRLKQWKNKLLSAAGKEVLLKAVTMALPAYAMSCMSCFKLLVRLCKDLSSMMSNFWWGEEMGKRKLIDAHGKD